MQVDAGDFLRRDGRIRDRSRTRRSKCCSTVCTTTGVGPIRRRLSHAHGVVFLVASVRYVVRVVRVRAVQSVVGLPERRGHGRQFVRGQRGVTVAVGRGGGGHGVHLAGDFGTRARRVVAVHGGAEDGGQRVHVRIVLGGGQPYADHADDDHQYGDEHHDAGHDTDDERVVVGDCGHRRQVRRFRGGRRLLLVGSGGRRQRPYDVRLGGGRALRRFRSLDDRAGRGRGRARGRGRGRLPGHVARQVVVRDFDQQAAGHEGGRGAHQVQRQRRTPQRAHVAIAVNGIGPEPVQLQQTPAVVQGGQELRRERGQLIVEHVQLDDRRPRQRYQQRRRQAGQRRVLDFYVHLPVFEAGQRAGRHGRDPLAANGQRLQPRVHGRRQLSADR